MLFIAFRRPKDSGLSPFNCRCMFEFRVPFLLVLSCFVLIQIPVQAQRTGNMTGEAHDKTKSAAIRQLMIDADLAMQFRNFSVTDNSPMPPGKGKNEYYSWAPYLWPNPETKDGYPYINRDGKTNPETEAKSDKPLLRRMAVSVHTLALAYAYSKDLKYAKKATDMIKTWFLDPITRMNPNMDYAQCRPGVEKGSAVGIIDSRWLTLVLDAEEILKQSSVFGSKESDGLKKWFASYLQWLISSELGKTDAANKNNHGTWYAVQTARYALFTGNIPLAKKIVESGKRFLDTQIDSLGRQTFELKRTKSFDYSLYNMHAIISMALIGDKVGVDLWHYNAQPGNLRNIEGSILFMAGFTNEEKKWPFQQIADKAIGLNFGDGESFSVYYPYDLCSALRIGYQVYKNPVFLETLNKLPKDLVETNRSALLFPLIK